MQPYREQVGKLQRKPANRSSRDRNVQGEIEMAKKMIFQNTESLNSDRKKWQSIKNSIGIYKDQLQSLNKDLDADNTSRPRV